MQKTGERLDDLQCEGLKLIQDPSLYCFTSDAVMLANFVKVRAGARVCELCTGSGVISLLLTKKCAPSHIAAVEMQECLADLAVRNVEYNGLSDIISVYNLAAQAAFQEIKGDWDAVVVNPPYEKADSGQASLSEVVKICRTEKALTFREVAEVSAKLLKNRGKLFFVHKAARLAELLFEIKKAGIEPKRVTLVRPKAVKAFDTVLVEGVKGGGEGVNITEVTVYNGDGTLTESASKLYGCTAE